MAWRAARCSEDSKSFMMAENAGRSLKLHIQQYLIRSYLRTYRSVQHLGETRTRTETSLAGLAQRLTAGGGSSARLHGNVFG